jgi:hypothetical protein
MRINPARSTRLSTVAAALAILASATACGGGGNSHTAAQAANDVAARQATGQDVSSGDIDSCTLLTDAQVSDLAGKALKHDGSGGGPLGCGYSEDGNSMSEFTVRGFTGSGSARDNKGDMGAEVQIADLAGVGDDAITASTEGTVNFFIAHKGSRYVELVTTFLDVKPGSPEFTKATQLANTALANIK